MISHCLIISSYMSALRITHCVYVCVGVCVCVCVCVHVCVCVCACVCVCVCVFEGIQEVSFVWEKLCHLFALLAQTECSHKLIFKKVGI